MKEDSPKLKHRAAAVDQAADEVTAPPPVVEDPAPAPDAQAPVMEEGQAPAASPLTPEQEARALVDLVVGMVVPFFPELKQIYDDAACERIAAVAAPLMAKYGFTVGSLFDRWKEEINFGVVVAPLVLQTVKALQAQRATAAPAAAAPKGDDVVAPLVMA